MGSQKSEPKIGISNLANQAPGNDNQYQKAKGRRSGYNFEAKIDNFLPEGGG